MAYYYPPNANLKIEQEFYATIDSIESIDESKVQIVFDGVLTSDFESVSINSISQVYEKIFPYLIILQIEKESLNEILPLSWIRNFIGKWFLLKTTNIQTSVVASLSIENSEFPETSTTFIYSIDRLYRDSETAYRLTHFFSINQFGRGNTRAINKHLESIYPGKNIVHKLNVYKVGQGSLTAVTDQSNTPLFYYDLGGAWWIFPKSYRRTLRLCFSKTKTVILSHWDLDHVETARRLFYSNPTLLQGITWIAPKQFLSPVYARLAARMNAAGTLILWSGNYVPEVSFWAGKLIKCTGPDKNHNGIALLVSSPINSIKNTLHPGDAAYTHIPGMRELELDGLVATHHGANFDYNNRPVPQSIVENGAIAYSHDNKYGHPTPNSISAHQFASWTNRLDTTNGNISFSLTPVITSVSCGSTNCDLSISQSF